MAWRAWARTLSCRPAPGLLFARENTRHRTDLRPGLESLPSRSRSKPREHDWFHGSEPHRQIFDQARKGGYSSYTPAISSVDASLGRFGGDDAFFARLIPVKGGKTRLCYLAY